MAANGVRFRGQNSYYGSATQPDEWSQTSYVSDHVCRPVVIDSEGRKRPIIAYPTTTECCVTEKLQQCPSPVDYGYGYGNDKWAGVASPVRDRPPYVEGFISKIQTEAGRPDRLDILNSSTWRQIQNSSPPQPLLGPDGYDRHHSDRSKLEWTRPIGNPNQNENYSNYYYNKNHITYSEPRVATPDGWGMTHESKLTHATNNIGTVMDYFKETAKPASAPYPKYSAPFPTDPRRVAYVETIDSKEAARRYGKPKLGFPASKPAETYATTIDSREAARKYNGTRE